jgi:hypothetical protein
MEYQFEVAVVLSPGIEEQWLFQRRTGAGSGISKVCDDVHFA